VEAAQIMEMIVDSGVRWSVSARKLPLLTSPMSQGTDTDPVAQIMAERGRLSAGIHVAAMPGFVYSDVARGGFTVAVSSPGEETAATPCDAMTDFVWRRKDAFAVTAVSPREGIMRALTRRAPTVVADVGDNIGGGSGGDGTEVLHHLLDLRVDRALVVVSDRSVAESAVHASVGDEIDVQLGGHLERAQGPSVSRRARVLSRSSGRYVATGAWMGGHTFDMGPTAVLRIDGVDVIVTSVATPPFHREQITSQGLSPEHYGVVVAKGAIAWQDGLADIADGAVFLDTRGSTPARPESLVRSIRAEGDEDWLYPATA
jgi:microcystin degradation protein MlrC